MNEGASAGSSGFARIRLALQPRLFFSLFLVFAVWTLTPVLPALLTGAALAFLSEPLTQRLHRRFNAPRHSFKAATLSVFTMLLLVAGFLLPFSIVVIETLERISASVRDLSGEFASQIIQSWSQRLRLLPEQLSIPVAAEQLTALLAQAAQKSLAWLGNTTASLVAQAPGAIFFSSVAFLSWGYCLWKGRILRIQALRFLLPWPQERALIRLTFAQLLKSLVAANLLVSLIQAAVIGIFLAATHVPHVLLWTSLAFFASFVPVVGTLPVTLGAALWCWSAEASPANTIAMLACAAIAGTVDNLLRPLLAKGQGQLDSFWLFLAIMGGLGQFGIAGFILGPLALALCMASAAALRLALKNK
ncbi:AI-2E family transporter [bacterium]|nr:AI-2E family transporter [bacterium]